MNNLITRRSSAAKNQLAKKSKWPLLTEENLPCNEEGMVVPTCHLCSETFTRRLGLQEHLANLVCVKYDSLQEDLQGWQDLLQSSDNSSDESDVILTSYKPSLHSASQSERNKLVTTPCSIKELNSSSSSDSDGGFLGFIRLNKREGRKPKLDQSGSFLKKRLNFHIRHSGGTGTIENSNAYHRQVHTKTDNSASSILFSTIYAKPKAQKSGPTETHNSASANLFPAVYGKAQKVGSAKTCNVFHGQVLDISSSSSDLSEDGDSSLDECQAAKQSRKPKLSERGSVLNRKVDVGISSCSSTSSSSSSLSSSEVSADSDSSYTHNQSVLVTRR